MQPLIDEYTPSQFSSASFLKNISPNVGLEPTTQRSPPTELAGLIYIIKKIIGLRLSKVDQSAR